ncbi:MAG TPA: hypothetical protein VNQ79_18615 [Blastocatellia bacterium]|nr:hypothetical protein [Blastocatellia bacterium]
MSLTAMKYADDLQLYDAAGREDPVAKAVLWSLCWSQVDGCAQVRVKYETLRRRTMFKPSAIRAALSRLSDEQTGYGLLEILSRTRGPQAEATFVLNLEKLRALAGAEQLELRMTSLRAVPEDPPSGGVSLPEDTPLSGETRKNNATQWRNSEKETPLSGETPAEIRHSVAKPGLHEGSHVSVSNSQPTTTPYPPPGGIAGGAGGGGGGGQEKIQPRSIHSRETLLRYAWASHTSRGGAIRNPQSFAEKRLADGEADLAVSIWLEFAGQAPRASPARRDEAAERLSLAEIISGHERRHWPITAALLDRAEPAEIAAKAQEILARAGPLHQWEAVVIEYAKNQALRARRKGIA